MNADLSIIKNQVYNWINESNTDFNLDFGENKLYLSVQWIDGKSLFIEDYFYFMNELIAAYCDLDRDTDEVKVIWFNRIFGIGSEYHGIADGRWTDDACDTESADLNKMEKERDI
jgi:hypothetical protein